MIVGKFVSSLVWEIKLSRKNFIAPTFVIGSDHYVFSGLTHQALFDLYELWPSYALWTHKVKWKLEVNNFQQYLPYSSGAFWGLKSARIRYEKMSHDKTA